MRAAAHAHRPAVRGRQAADPGELVQRSRLCGGRRHRSPVTVDVVLDEAGACVGRGRLETVADSPAVCGRDAGHRDK